MVKNNLVGKVKETIAKLPAHAQKDETVVREKEGGKEGGEEGNRARFFFSAMCVSLCVAGGLKK